VAAVALSAAVLTFLPASPASAVGCGTGTEITPGLCQEVITASGTWTVPTGVTAVDALVVGGGGGGGGNNTTFQFTPNGGDEGAGSGGGGGQARVFTNLSVTPAASVAVTIGAGGAGGTVGPGTSWANPATDVTVGVQGGSSTFGSSTVAGGFGGNIVDSGGGGTSRGRAGGTTIQYQDPWYYPATAQGGLAVSTNYTVYPGAGGGGAGAGSDGVRSGRDASGSPATAGAAQIATIPGPGGAGIVATVGLFNGLCTASPNTVSYGGGGGGAAFTGGGAGGAGGAGGGGAGASGTSSAPVAGTANKGGGGGGGGAPSSGTGGAGGTGVIVLRWLTPGTSGSCVAPSLSPASQAVAATAGSAITSTTAFTPTGFTGSVTYAVSPALPGGLLLSSSTGVVSGTPTATSASTSYTVTGTGATSGTATATITITVSAAGGGGGGSSSGGGSSTPVVDPTPTPTPTPSATATVAAAVSLDPIPNQVNANIPVAGVPQGGSVFLVNGVPAPVTVTPNAQQAATALDINGPDFTMKLSGRGDDADPLGLGEKSQLILQSPVVPTRRSGAVRSASAGVRSAAMAKCVLREPLAVSSGTGFQAGSPVKMYLLPSTYIGELIADASGSYSGSLPVPAGVQAGVQTLQVNGFSSTGAVRSLSLGITVIPARVVTTKTEKGNVFFEPLSTVISPQGEATLNGLVRKAKKQGVRTVVLGFVQETATTSNDDSLSTQRARAVASYLRDRGLKGAYVIRGDGVAGPGDAARRVNVNVTYQSGC
jgi:hypothetical protein